MNLYIYSYNNYYNRQMKKAGDSLEDYQNFLHYGPIQGVQGFTPGDGVNTTQIIGTNAMMYDGKGDYLIATDEFGNIVSRWFIMDVNRTRSGQWALTLHRDLIVDYYEEIIESPMFIEKATLNSNNPLIFNSENMTVNQIKTSETLLKDKSDCAWIVGYYAKNTPAENLRGTVNFNLNDSAYDIEIDKPFANWEFNATTEPFFMPPSSLKYLFYGKNIEIVSNSGKPGYITIDKNNGYEKISIISSTNSTLDFGTFGSVMGMSIGSKVVANKDKLYSEIIVGKYAEITTTADANYFLNLQGKVVKDSTGAFYRIGISPGNNVIVYEDIKSGNLYNSLNNIVMSTPYIQGSSNSSSFRLQIEKQEYFMKAEELTSLETTWDMTAPKLATEDAPYNIFAIPFGETTLKDNMTNVWGYSTEQASIATLNSIIQKMTPSSSGGFLYDVQLLPYCPLDIIENGIIEVKSTQAFSGVKDSDDKVITYILNVPTSKFSKNIYLTNPIEITNAKMQNECDMYKLCSPNWASEFQFNAAKNGGVTFFNIDCEYKPYAPYIHINPNFGELYGRDFNDARGLILSGDFSLTQISDAWQQYQIQNKNFQNIFDRQIQNMELQHKVGRLQDIVGGISGAVTGASAGALAGSMFGVGTGVGAVIGGVTSAIGGVADYAINEKLRAEAIDYTKDNFGYQLGNVQALPYTLTKVSAYNNNNKIFPVLEYYTCTDVEKEAVANKIAWNGMSVGVIGKMADYINNDWSYNDIKSKGYIKGQLIRLELPINHKENKHNEDFQLVNAISGELNKGVYIK